MINQLIKYNSNRRLFFVSFLTPGLDDFVNKFLPKSDSYNQWFYAVSMDYVKICKKLLSYGFDPNTIEDKKYDSALILAVRNNSVKVFNLLIKHPNIDLNLRSKNGDTALMIACYQSKLIFASKLILKGAQINMPFWSPLHYAAASGSIEITQLLVAHKAVIDAKSPNATTPLMMAARGGHLKIVKYLTKIGANLKLKNELGYTAKDFSKKFKKNNITEFLEKNL